MNFNAVITAENDQQSEVNSNKSMERCPFHQKLATFKLDKSSKSMKAALSTIRDNELQRFDKVLDSTQKEKFESITDAILESFTSIASNRAKEGGDQFNSEALSKTLEKLFDLNECPAFKKK